ncbi:putative E3 ubiquitin-protein ligase LIN, partial [Tanacetum coccineum]
MADSLLCVVQKREDEFLKMCMRPKAASVMLLAQITENDDDGVVLEVIKSIVSSKAMESIIKSFKSESTEERIAAMKILLRRIQENGKCRNVVADKAELAPVLESFLDANDQDRFAIVQFLSELVRLNRRTFNDQILHIIKDEGTFSTMHTLLIYLQTALTDQSPIIAGLLLQLDLVDLRHLGRSGNIWDSIIKDHSNGEVIEKATRFFPGSSKDPDGIVQFLGGKTSVSEATNDVIKYFTATVNYEVAVPEGLPLAVTLTLIAIIGRPNFVNSIQSTQPWSMSKMAICRDMAGTTWDLVEANIRFK